MRLADIRPSPENDKLYRPVDRNDPDIRALAASIQEFGAKEPLVVTEDGWILSGHRRYVAARLAGLTIVPCRIESIRREDDPDGFVRLLREFNRQRDKSFDEKLREEVVSANPEEAHRVLIEHRRSNSDMSGFGVSSTVEMWGNKRRAAISAAKMPFLDAAKRVIADRRAFWPLSDRSIHYALLNDPPLRHAAKPESRYANDKASYKDPTDLLTRARLAGDIQWHAIGDETRPVTIWDVHSDVRSFIQCELNDAFKGYWRDYQRSQPNHIEIVAEKLTVRGIVQPVAQDFCIPLTVGRGYCSIVPRREMAERFRKSGKDRLIVLLISDFDPDGEAIAQSFARSMRDDFEIEKITPIKVALTAEQVQTLKLPPQMKAKVGSSTYAQFTERHGDDVFELEAVAPEELQRILRAAIDSVLDTEMYNNEVDREREEAAYLQSLRKTVHKTLAQVTADNDGGADE